MSASPKDQLREVICPVDWLMKLTVSGAFPVTGGAGFVVKLATGGGKVCVTVTVCVWKSVPPGPVTVSVTV